MDERIVPGELSWTQHHADHVARYLFAAGFCQGRRVLDAGCGVGYGSTLLITAGAAEVCGVDIDDESVSRAKTQFGALGATFLVDDCQALANVSGPFDVICSFENIEHLERPERFLQRAGQLLAADGALLVSTPDRQIMPPFVNGKPRNEFHHHEWYLAEFRQLLEAHFAEVEMRVQVSSHSLRQRQQGLDALREGLLWANPLLTFLWRKWPFGPKSKRGWKKLAGLAAPSAADFPIVPERIAPLYGESWCHFAICRKPILAMQDSKHAR